MRKRKLTSKELIGPTRKRKHNCAIDLYPLGSNGSVRDHLYYCIVCARALARMRTRTRMRASQHVVHDNNDWSVRIIVV